MIIHQSHLLKLEYESRTDILLAHIPTVPHLLVPEVTWSFELIVEHARNYDVKRILLDAREAKIEVTEEAFTGIVGSFVKNLLSTRVQKLARVVSSSTLREGVVKKVFSDSSLPLQFQTFTEREPALEWLQS